MIMLYKSITENGGPCVNCVVRPICMKKLWGKVVITCGVFSKYMLKSSGILEAKKASEINYYYSPLNKHYTITKDMNGKIMFGKGDARYAKRDTSMS
jgi:hypothetical protein